MLAFMKDLLLILSDLAMRSFPDLPLQRSDPPFHLAAFYDDPTQKNRMSFSTPRDE